MHRRWLFIAVAGALIVVSLIVGLVVDHEGDTGGAEAKPAAGTQGDVPPATVSPTASVSATEASVKPSAKRTPRKESARPTATRAKPSAADAPRTGSASAPLAGRIRPGATYRGVATFYDSDGSGACMYDASGDVLTGAMNSTDYETAKACGAYVLVRAANGASITVRITNECPGDCAPGQIDLSAEAFAKLAQPSAGLIPITWTLASPSAAGTVSIRYKTGSSRYWCGIQVIGHRNPVARLEVRAGSGWRQLSRAEYNYFVSDDGSGCGGAIRVTDIFGEQLTLNGVALTANAVQSTGAQFARR